MLSLYLTTGKLTKRHRISSTKCPRLVRCHAQIAQMTLKPSDFPNSAVQSPLPPCPLHSFAAPEPVELRVSRSAERRGECVGPFQNRLAASRCCGWGVAHSRAPDARRTACAGFGAERGCVSETNRSSRRMDRVPELAESRRFLDVAAAGAWPTAALLPSERVLTAPGARVGVCASHHPRQRPMPRGLGKFPGLMLSHAAAVGLRDTTALRGSGLQPRPRDSSFKPREGTW
jgi:hypothetical protein